MWEFRGQCGLHGQRAGPGSRCHFTELHQPFPRGFRCSSSPSPLQLEHSRADSTRRDLLGHEDAPSKASPPCNPQENPGVSPPRKEHVSCPTAGLCHRRGREHHKAPHNLRSIYSPNSAPNSEITTRSCDNQQTAGSVKSSQNFGGIGLCSSPYTHAFVSHKHAKQEKPS